MSLGSTSMDEQNGGFKNCGEPINYCSTTHNNDHNNIDAIV